MSPTCGKDALEDFPSVQPSPTGFGCSEYCSDCPFRSIDVGLGSTGRRGAVAQRMLAGTKSRNCRAGNPKSGASANYATLAILEI
jgi:hypothetical protein